MKKLFFLLFLLYSFESEAVYSSFLTYQKIEKVKSVTIGFSGGKGILSDPYKVTSAAQLNEIRNYPDAHFIQIADIDLGKAPWNEGKGWTPIVGDSGVPFNGSYNGNNYKILNLTINRPDSSYIGLFGRTVAATVTKVNLINALVKGKNFVGVVAGLAIGGTYADLKVSGNLTGNGEYAGGIFGMITNAIVSNSQSQTNVNGFHFVGGIAGSGMATGCNASGKISGTVNGNVESSVIGGLLGNGYSINSHASGEVTGGSEVGGLIGSGSAQGCYATGNVTATGDYVGGLIGDLTAFGDENGPDQEYATGIATPADSVKLTKSVTSENGKITIVNLQDGTRLLVPAYSTPLQITFEKKGFDVSPDEIIPKGSDFRSTGSIRYLKIEGTGDFADIKPIITIPASEAGTINVETINVMRVGTMFVNGDLIENHTFILSVRMDENGNFKFIDPIFPYGVKPDSTKSATINPTKPADGMRLVGEVQYFLMSFDKSLNWSKRPVLERMIPDSTLKDNGFRRLASNANADERKKLVNQPVCNIVVLVHGHNEEEKTGFIENKINSPWGFKYKQQVWDLLYEDVSKNRDKQFPVGCTAFYEFIAPTYRPIFSPVPERSAFEYKTLGEDLGALINKEIQSNPQFKAMLDANMPFNLYLIAHSQGGLVARAGLRFVSPEILKNLKLVITWGSPHRGAALTTMRYALTAGHNIVIDNVDFPLQNIGGSKDYQTALDNLAIDAPGTRDMRWDSSKKEMLRLGELFKENTNTINEFPDSELPYGKYFFNDNLKIFNEKEHLFISDFLKGKYRFYDGATSKEAPLELGWTPWSIYRVYYFGKKATSIEQGAGLHKLVLKPDWIASDGGVPVYSARAEGIWLEGNIQRRDLGDVDHEEFYGAEAPQRNKSTIAKGNEVVRLSFYDMEIKEEKASCPKLEITTKESGDSLIVSGKLLFFEYLKKYGGDELPGKRMQKIELHRDKASGELVKALKFSIKDDGSFTWKGFKTDVPVDTITVVAFFKDNSQVSGNFLQTSGNTVINTAKNIWYTAIQKAIDAASPNDIIMVYPGTYEEALTIRKDLVLKSSSGKDVTILKGLVNIYDCSPRVEGFSILNYFTGFSINETTGNKTIQPIIENNIIADKSTRGVLISGKAAPKITNNVFTNTGNYAIEFDRNNIIRGDVRPIISGNTISGNTSMGIRIDKDVAVDVIGNTINKTRVAIYLTAKSSATISNNTLTDNTDSGIQIYLATDSITISNNIIKQNGIGIDAYAKAKVTITGNIIQSNSNGILYRSDNGGKVFILKNTVSGSLKSTTNPNGGLGISIGAGAIATIKGNTISNNVSYSRGGGIAVGSPTSCDISENTITGNSSTDLGGGIYGGGNGLIIKQNIISKNTAANGGGIYTDNTAAIEGNTIKDNYASKLGGGIYGIGGGWAKTEVVKVNGKDETVIRHVPCFAETTNTYSGNSHGQKFGAWGPGTDKWCDDAGFDVYVW